MECQTYKYVVLETITQNNKICTSGIDEIARHRYNTRSD